MLTRLVPANPAYADTGRRGISDAPRGAGSCALLQAAPGFSQAAMRAVQAHGRWHRAERGTVRATRKRASEQIGTVPAIGGSAHGPFGSARQPQTAAPFSAGPGSVR